jgi:hypothetical protein
MDMDTEERPYGPITEEQDYDDYWLDPRNIEKYEKLLAKAKAQYFRKSEHLDLSFQEY